MGGDDTVNCRRTTARRSSAGGPVVTAHDRAQALARELELMFAGRGQGDKRGMGLYFCRLIEAGGSGIDDLATEIDPRWAVRLPRPRLAHLAAGPRGEGWGKVDRR